MYIFDYNSVREIFQMLSCFKLLLHISTKGFFDVLKFVAMNAEKYI